MDKILGYDVDGYRTYIAFYDRKGLFMQDWARNYKYLHRRRICKTMYK